MLRCAGAGNANIGGMISYTLLYSSFTRLQGRHFCRVPRPRSCVRTCNDRIEMLQRSLSGLKLPLFYMYHGRHQ
jgi:hypothetical protein